MVVEAEEPLASSDDDEVEVRESVLVLDSSRVVLVSIRSVEVVVSIEEALVTVELGEGGGDVALGASRSVVDRLDSSLVINDEEVDSDVVTLPFSDV